MGPRNGRITAVEGAEARAGDGEWGRPAALRSPTGYWAGVGERQVRVIPMIASNTITHIT